MSLPGNGIFAVQGEMAMLVTAMRRSTRWGSHSFLSEEYDILMRTFQDLKIILNQVEDLKLLDPLTFLSPFLEVIRSKETTGPVTSLALSAIHKFLSYGLIDPTHPSVPATVEDIADAVTHARFVGTDHASDGVVLMKILQVLRTLMLSPEGAMLSDESVCEIMLSCFRICFETRLSELLRRNAEQCLRDMTQLIFMRLPQFPPEDAGTVFSSLGLSLKKKNAGKGSKKKGIVSVQNTTGSLERKSPTNQVEEPDSNKTGNSTSKHVQDKNLINEAEITIEPIDQPIKSHAKKHGRHSSMDLAAPANTAIVQIMEKCVGATETGDDATSPEQEQESEVQSDSPNPELSEVQSTEDNSEGDGAKISKTSPDNEEKLEEYINDRGIRFTPQNEVTELQPYGLVCVRELFRFLISLCNPLDTQNTSGMVHLGLCLLQTALEVAGDHLASYPTLLNLVKDPLCRNLVSLLSTERISIFGLDLQVSYLIFESLRFHLKYQMEAFFKKIIDILSIDTTKSIYELKEIHHLSLEFLAQMFGMPGFCTEMYLNYDCDIYCMDLFENLTKLLSQNVVSSTAYNIHSLSLEVLMTIIEAIEASVNQGKIEELPSKSDVEETTDQPTTKDVPETKYGRGGHISLELGGLDDASVVSDHVTQDISLFMSSSKLGRHKMATESPTDAELDSVKTLKKYLTRGIELFNSHPEKGIEYLQKHGYLNIPLDPKQVANFLKECPHLDKKMIGEYICKRSGHEDAEDGFSVLTAFAASFDFSGLRVEQALRLYLETFRLPGEAPLIFLVMERFAERWHTTNGEPFANTDAAFRLAYAVIMLNMDQHNHNAKKLNVPMTVEDFVKNLRGCNGSGDYDQAMLEAVFHSIKNEEMVMPAERVGPVRDAYLWRELVRRRANYRPPAVIPVRLYRTVAAPTVTALSSAFERAAAPTKDEIECNSRDSVALFALRGLERCAILTALAPATPGTDERTDAVLSVDALILTLCKFTGLTAQTNYIAIGVTLGQSTKCQLSLVRACALLARLGDSVREAWRHLVEIVKILYVGRLLPKTLIEAEDYLAPNKTVSLIRDSNRGADAGLLSSIYSYIALGETGLRAPTIHEKNLIEVAAQTVAKCNLPGLLISETKFLQVESLQELVRAIIAAGAPPDGESAQLNPQLEDITIFYLELLARVLLQNRDRALYVWEESAAHFRAVVLWASGLENKDYALVRTTTTLLRTAARLMRSETCAATVLDSLNVLFELPYKQFYQLADIVSSGVHEVVKLSAQNVHRAPHWRRLLALLQAAGIGAWPTPTGSSRSECSSDEERRPTSGMSDTELTQSPRAQGWIIVKSESTPSALDIDPEDVTLRLYSPTALARCCETLALVVRDVAHVTPDNAPLVVYTLRLFVAATLKDANKHTVREKRTKKRGQDSSDEEIDNDDQNQQVNIQLLDLMHTLHSRAAQIFKWWRDESEQGEEYDLWELAWMPLLQGIAVYCTDRRKQVSNAAIAYLQRALLAPGLASGAQWDAAFTRVLFPLMDRLKDSSRPDLTLRANTIMCKVFLHHLSALRSRQTFASLWLRAVGIQRALLAAPHEPLAEAAHEALKNALLVMHSVKIFNNGDGYTDLWYITWEKIGEFLPNLKNELFPDVDPKPPTIPNQPQPTIPQPIPTLIPPSNSSINQSNLPQSSPPINQSLNSPMQIPGNPSFLSQSPVLSTSPTVNVPVSGMVPIRNPLLTQGGLTSSVLLQPLNEMISTPIGISISSQMPILYPTTESQQPQLPTNQNEPYSLPIEPYTQQPIINPNVLTNQHVEQSELYSEYLSNPYNELKEISQKENANYEPKDYYQSIPTNQSVNPSISNLDPNQCTVSPIEQKCFSEHSSPMHSVTMNQFGSTDNIKKDESIYNFSSYFSSGNQFVHPGNDVFDNLMSTQEG